MPIKVSRRCFGRSDGVIDVEMQLGGIDWLWRCFDGCRWIRAGMQIIEVALAASVA